MQKNVTLKDFLDTWLDTVIKGNIRASSYTTYRGYIKNHIIESLGHYSLAELKAETIQAFIQELNGGKKRLSAKTIHGIYTMLKSSLQCAVDYELAVKNPCCKIRLPKLEEKEIDVFKRDEQKRIETAILNSGDSRTLGVLICLYTGIRIGELCTLKWENVNFKDKQIYIKLSVSRVSNYDAGSGKKTRLAEEQPKTQKSKRFIPIPDFLYRLLKQQYKVKRGAAYVISMKNGKPVQPRTMQLVYARLLKAAKVRYCNFHTLRHTFATRAIELGADIKTLSETLGHSNCSITMNRYIHSLMEQKQKMMRQFNTFFISKKIENNDSDDCSPDCV